MATFKYKAKDKTGQTVSGSMIGEDRRVVVKRLQETGHFVLDVRESRKANLTFNPITLLFRWVLDPLFGGASIGQLVVFYRQFATMLKSGMSLAHAMASLRNQGGSRVLRKVAAETLDVVNNGGTLSDAFSRYPWVFPELHVSLIRAAEMGGTLEPMVGKIADYLERENAVRTRLRFATLYPKILVVAVILIPNAPILIMDSPNAYMHATSRILLPMLLLIGVIWAGFRLLTQVPAVRYIVDLIKISVPKLGKMVRMLALAKFYRTLGAMYSAGTPLSQGLMHAANASGNWYMTMRLRKAAQVVDRGQPLSGALRNTGVIPGMALDMIATGEQTGNVDEMLEKAAEYTENDAEVLVFQTTMILGLLLFMVIAGYIGFIVIQSYSGYYKNITTEQ